jgi:2-C-methyl-D-erythritol 2,4-cyclodiphosphate synthase
MGDLGMMFPAEEKWRDASSIDLLGEIRSSLASQGWAVVNVDATVLAESPRLAPHTVEMANRIAVSLEIGFEMVSVKATTTDGLGFTGRGEGIAALAVALIENVG